MMKSNNNLQPQLQPGLSFSLTPRFVNTFTDHLGAYDLGELEQPLPFQFGKEQNPLERNFAGLARVSLNIAPTGMIAFDNKMGSPSAASADSRSLSHSLLQRGAAPGLESTSSQRVDVWGESHAVDDNSPRTDTSTVVEHDGKNQKRAADRPYGNAQRSTKTVSDGVLAKNGDSKAQRRLAQNREAARKSRLRKKAYVQQLENSRMRLNQIEQELQRARQQVVTCNRIPTNVGLFASNGIPTDQQHVINNSVMNGIVNSGSVAFEMEYVRWLAEENGKMNDLRIAVQNHVGDDELRALLDGLMSHYEEIYSLKSVAAKADVFHILSGMWKTPAERCFLWMGGHRPSELLKIVLPQLEPMTEQQVLGICNLQQNSQQAEDALSQGMDSLQQSLAETLSNGSLGAPGNVTNYMGQMAMAMGKLGTFESFVRQADQLRLQTRQQLQRILTTRQYSRALLVTHEYFTRLRALSSLWLARPRD